MNDFLENIKIGDAYLSANNSLIGQIFVVTDMEEIETRFDKPNRIVTITRYAMKANGGWFRVASGEKVWAKSELGPKVPDELVGELYAN